MDKVECVVTGAGVIGLAIARRLAQAGREVIVLEAAEGIGTITSSRNSEVIHAGIYYRAGSLMAQMCVSGKRALYRYCADHGIPHRNCDAALLSPSTGIIDSHAYMLALRGDAEEAGAAYAFHTPLLRARANAGSIEIEAGGDAPMTLACDLLV